MNAKYVIQRQVDDATYIGKGKFISTNHPFIFGQLFDRDDPKFLELLENPYMDYREVKFSSQPIEVKI